MLIESTRNEKIQLLASLESSKGRKNSGLFLVEGPKLLEEALDAGWMPEFAVYDQGKPRCALLASRLQNLGIVAYTASVRAIAAASQTKTPQGIVAAVRMRVNATPISPIVILDGVQDPGNTGSIMRAAEAAGFGGIVLGPKCADIYAPKTVRSTMGSIFRIAIKRAYDLAQEISDMHEQGYFIAAAAINGENFFERKPHHEKKAALLIGSEGNGISQTALSLADGIYSLPMLGKAQSLNAAVAAGIMMYDWMRRGDGRVCGNCHIVPDRL